MTALKKPVLILLASALVLAGCVLSKPSLFIDPLSATGKPRPSFVAGEVPTVSYTVPPANTSGAAIKVRSQPSGATVRRVYAPSNPINVTQSLTSDLDPPKQIEPANKIQFPGLAAGNYTAELWIKGRLENTLDFSVVSDADRAEFAPARGINPRASLVIKKHSTRMKSSARGATEFAVDQLDTFVGLTHEQKKAAEKIFLDENVRLQAITSAENRLLQRSAIYEATETQIRALLTLEQQKLYDDDGSAGWAGNRLTESLDELVGLTPEQKIEAGKIFDDQSLALKKLTSIDDRMKSGVDIRQKAQARIRALLTPQQLAIYDEAPERPAGGPLLDPDSPILREMRAGRADIGNLIKKSTAVAARLGPVTQVTYAGGNESISASTTKFSTNSISTSTSASNEHSSRSSKGCYRYEVRGNERSEMLTVYWEKPSLSAPVKIARIEGSDGTAIVPE